MAKIIKSDTPTIANRNQRRRQRTRETILAAAELVFRRKGIDGTTVNDITEQADAPVVADFYRQCPLIRFVGRQSKVVDICGEKLNEEYVRTIVTDILKKHNLNASFWMMAPEASSEARPFYALFVQFDAAGVQIDERNILIGGDLLHNIDVRNQRRMNLAVFAELPPAIQRTIRAETGGVPIRDIQKNSNNDQVVYRVLFQNALLFPPLYIAADGSVLLSADAGG